MGKEVSKVNGESARIRLETEDSKTRLAREKAEKQRIIEQNAALQKQANEQSTKLQKLTKEIELLEANNAKQAKQSEEADKKRIEMEKAKAKEAQEEPADKRVENAPQSNATNLKIDDVKNSTEGKIAESIKGEEKAEGNIKKTEGQADEKKEVEKEQDKAQPEKEDNREGEAANNAESEDEEEVLEDTTDMFEQSSSFVSSLSTNQNESSFT